jgi:3-oxoacyl-[acyl-carrier protein] reductase
VIGDKLRLDGRTILVAGAGGGGIGTSACRGAAELGANVVGIDIADGPLAEAEAATVAAGGRFRGVVADVCSKGEVVAAVATAAEAFGSVDGLIHVVGGQRPHHWHTLDGYPESTIDEVFALNFKSAFMTSQSVAEHMIRAGHGGAIAQVASVAALVAAPYSMAYGAAKAALVSMTKTMAVEWGRHGIRVNAIAAGTIATPHSRGVNEDDVARDAVLPLKRRGTPDELAGTALFSISDLAGFITGQTIVVDGGSSIRPSYLDVDDIPVFMEDGEIRGRLTGP